jgi:rhodanese-related sulfurtransferase
MDIDCGELVRQLGDDEVLIIDIRSPEEWDALELHIPGALRMGLDELSENPHVLPDDELIVLYGWAPDCTNARRARRQLRLSGRMAVCLVGGLQSWVSSGYPTERHPREAHAEASHSQ